MAWSRVLQNPTAIKHIQIKHCCLYSVWRQHRFKKLYHNWIHDKKGQACLKLTAEFIYFYLLFIESIVLDKLIDCFYDPQQVFDPIINQRLLFYFGRQFIKMQKWADFLIIDSANAQLFLFSSLNESSKCCPALVACCWPNSISCYLSIKAAKCYRCSYLTQCRLAAHEYLELLSKAMIGNFWVL